MKVVFPRQYISGLITGAIQTLSRQTENPALLRVAFDVDYKEGDKFGDYASNAAFGLSKAMKISPLQAAEKLKAVIESEIAINIERIDIAGGGFLNFFFRKDYFADSLKTLSKLSQKNYTDSDRKKIIVEYSSPNVAKPMHVGHLRNTVLGNALANLYEFRGHKVIRWNHIGDWGTQFGKLIVAYRKWGDKNKIEKNPIEELLNLYVRFHKEMEHNPHLEKEGREEFKKLENGDKENKNLLAWFLKESLKEFNRLYKLLGIKKFDKEIGESYYSPLIPKLIEELKKNKLMEQSEGAWIIRLDAFKLPPALIQKTDGSTLYMTREVASLKYRIKKFNPSKILYVVGSEQSLHFEQLFAIARLLGIKSGIGEHVKYELILGPDGKKLSTREGNIVTAQEIINQAVEASEKIVNEKRKDLSAKEKEVIAREIGINSLKYYMLKDGRMTPIIFNTQAMLSLSGNSAPYLNYAYARLSNIISKAKHIGRGDAYTLEEPELALIKKMLAFDDVLIKSAQNSSLHPVTDYLFELANQANRFYESTPILTDTMEKRKNSRLQLIKEICRIMEIGFEITGIHTLSRI
jgi:arginyl-tRNA synthetase